MQRSNVMAVAKAAKPTIRSAKGGRVWASSSTMRTLTSATPRAEE